MLTDDLSFMEGKVVKFFIQNVVYFVLGIACESHVKSRSQDHELALFLFILFTFG